VWTEVRTEAMEFLESVMRLSDADLILIREGKQTNSGETLFVVPAKLLDYYVGRFLNQHPINKIVMDVENPLFVTYRPLEGFEAVKRITPYTQLNVSVQFVLQYEPFDVDNTYNFQEQAAANEYFKRAYQAGPHAFLTDPQTF